MKNQNSPAVDDLAESFLARLRDGEHPSISEYANAHPEIADEIREVFPTLAMLENAGQVSQAEIKPDGFPKTRVPRQLGDYRIHREIGRGGMGVVYEAEHITMRRRVALKLLTAELATNPTQLKRFLGEARAAGRLHHTNIVPVFEVGEHDGIHYYTMQYIQGDSLDEVINEIRVLSQDEARTELLTVEKTRGDRDLVSRTLAGQLISGVESPAARELETQPVVQVPQGPKAMPASADPTRLVGSSKTTRIRRRDEATRTDATNDYFRRVARVGLQVAEALAYAHGQKVLHRDIKPSNLILDLDGVVWITDFGLAKQGEENLTRTGDIIGTLRYLAPERLNGNADERSDIHGLGLTLYEMCTLRPAFSEPDRVQLIKQVSSADPPQPRKINPHIPLDLETIVLKAIDRQPSARYQTAAEVADDLRLFLADRPVQARRTTTVEHLWRWCRRNPVPFGLLLIVLLLLGVVFGGALSFGIASNRQARLLADKTFEAQKSEAIARGYVQETLENLFESTRFQVDALRFSGQVGRRTEGLRLLRDSVSRLQQFDGTASEKEQLRMQFRNQAIACLANVDFETVGEWCVQEPWTVSATFDANYERYAQSDTAGQIEIRSVDENESLATFPGPGYRAWVLQFSANGKYLAAKYHPPGKAAHEVSVWDVERKQKIVTVKKQLSYGPFDFSRDSKLFFVGTTADAGGTIRCYELPTGALKEIPVPIHPREVYFDDHTNQIAVADASSFHVVLHEMNTERQTTVDTPNYIHRIATSANGDFACGCEDGNIYVWKLHDLKSPPTVIAGHSRPVLRLLFNRRGDRLVSSAWDGTLRVWDFESRRELMRIDNATPCCRYFAPDDTQLGYATKRYHLGIWNCLDRGPLQKLASDFGPNGSIDFSPKTPYLLLAVTDQKMEFWRADTCERIQTVELKSAYAGEFDRDGDSVLISSRHGVYRWPVHYSESDGSLTAGSPELVLQGSSYSVDVTSPDHTLVRQDSFVWRVGENGTKDRIGPHERMYSITASPNDKWVVTTTWNRHGVRVWDQVSGKLEHELEPAEGTAFAKFAPDGKSLAISSHWQFALWDVANWTRSYQIPRTSEDGWVGSVAFSPDGSMVASSHSRQGIQLIETQSGRSLAVLSSNEKETLRQFHFNCDGTLLAAHSDDSIHVWNLNDLRLQLKALNLNWEMSAPDQRRFPPAGGPAEN